MFFFLFFYCHWVRHILLTHICLHNFIFKVCINRKMQEMAHSLRAHWPTQRWAGPTSGYWAETAKLQRDPDPSEMQRTAAAGHAKGPQKFEGSETIEVQSDSSGQPWLPQDFLKNLQIFFIFLSINCVLQFRLKQRKQTTHKTSRIFFIYAIYKID